MPCFCLPSENLLMTGETAPWLQGAVSAEPAAGSWEVPGLSGRWRLLARLQGSYLLSLLCSVKFILEFIFSIQFIKIIFFHYLIVTVWI